MSADQASQGAGHVAPEEEPDEVAVLVPPRREPDEIIQAAAQVAPIAESNQTTSFCRRIFSSIGNFFLAIVRTLFYIFYRFKNVPYEEQLQSKFCLFCPIKILDQTEKEWLRHRKVLS